MQQVILLVTIFVLGLAPSAQSAGLGSGTINILWPSANTVLYDELRVFPGQKIKLILSGSMDVDHHYYRVRRCKYFGLKCWWENRDRANFVGITGLGIELSLSGDTTDVSTKPKITNGVVYSDKGHERIDLTVLSKSGQETTTFQQGLTLKGYIPNPMPKVGTEFHRRECRGRPRYCSAGSINVSVGSVDSTKRVNYLKGFIKDNLNSIDVNTLTSSNVLDRLTTSRELNPGGDAHINKLVSAIHAEIYPLIGSNPTSSRAGRYIDMAKHLQNGLNPTDKILISQISNGMTTAMLQRGDWGQALANSEVALEQAQDQFDENSPTISSTCNYMTALKNAAIGWRERNARNSSEDISVAVSFLEQAIGIGDKQLAQMTDADSLQECGVTGQAGGKRAMLGLLSSISTDAARMMNLVRGEFGLARAESFLLKAICYEAKSIDSPNMGAECAEEVL